MAEHVTPSPASSGGLGKALARDLDRMKISQREIADLFGKSQQSVSKWIDSDRVPRAYHAGLVQRLGESSDFARALFGGLGADSPSDDSDSNIRNPHVQPAAAYDGTVEAAVKHLLPRQLQEHVAVNVKVGHQVAEADYASPTVVIAIKSVRRPEPEDVVSAVSRASMQLQYLKTMIGNARRFVVALVVPHDPGTYRYHAALQKMAAQTAAIGLDLLVVRSPGQLAEYITSIEREPPPPRPS